MLIDRCPHDDIFARVPQMAARIDPILHQLDVLLDDDALYQLVREDVCHRRPRTRTFGRPSTPGETILRMLLLKHLHDRSFQETVDQVDQNPGIALVLPARLARRAGRDHPDAVGPHPAARDAAPAGGAHGGIGASGEGDDGTETAD